MDSNLRNLILNYFNVTLKSSLGYRESYLPPTYNPYEGIIFFGKLNPNQPEDLKGILWSNPKIVSQLKENLISVLSPHFENLQEIKLIFNINGFGIDIQRGNIQMLNVDPYVNIAVNLDTLEQLDNFCKSSHEILNVCRTKEFWRSLLHKIFPKTYKGVYNYERVYKGYLGDKSGNFEQNNLEYAKFLLNEDFARPYQYENLMISTIRLGDTHNFDKLYDYLKSTNVDTDTILKNVFYQELLKRDKIFIANFLNNVLSNPKYHNTINIDTLFNISPDRLEKLSYMGKFFTISNLKFMRENLKNKDDRIKLNDVFLYKGNIINNDDNFLKFILSTGEYNLHVILWMIGNMIENRDHYPSDETLSVIRSYVTPLEYQSVLRKIKDAGEIQIKL